VTIILFAWIVVIVGPVTKKLYSYFLKKNMPVNKAIYYNRKVIHMAAGLAVLLAPFFYSTPILPFILSMAFAILTYIPHRIGKLLCWFQTEENMYEVHFCLMCGVVITLSWIVFNGNFWYGVIPVSFMAFGDAVTGIVRNMLYGYRTKSWYGNLAMLGVTLPIGALIGVPGIIAAVVASFVEHFEFKGIDDNIIVPISSFITILVLSSIFK